MDGRKDGGREMERSRDGFVQDKQLPKRRCAWLNKEPKLLLRWGCGRNGGGVIELYAALVLDDQRAVLSRITIPAAGRRKETQSSFFWHEKKKTRGQRRINNQLGSYNAACVQKL